MSEQKSDGVYIGMGETPAFLELKYGNRHGLIAGATGTGKTVTLQTLAEGFSSWGVPVFAVDIKGDLSGMAMAGTPNEFLSKRCEQVGLEYAPAAAPVVFWDVFGERGHPVRATISEMGPLLLSRILGLNDTQEGVLNIAFKIADDEGLLLIDLKDLKSLLQHVAENADQLTTEYGNVTKQTIGTIQRAMLVLEQQGGEQFFGEPALKLTDFIRTAPNGNGVVNLLAADKLYESPRLYATFLLWLLSELFEVLPEVGDLDKPKLVFFFDEAHLLFTDASPMLLQKIEQVVRLIRSKGVGIYFVTQNPLDIPDKVAAQLGNRIQHALRAFTPREQQAVRAASETFRANPKLNTSTAIMELGKGEALVSTLEGNGVPSIVQKTLIRPPFGKIGAIDAGTRQQIMNNSAFAGVYEAAVDRESAYETLAARVQAAASEQQAPQAQSGGGVMDMLGGLFGGSAQAAPASGSTRAPAAGRQRMGMGETIAKQVARSVASSVGRQIGQAVIRGVLGSMLRR